MWAKRNEQGAEPLIILFIVVMLTALILCLAFEYYLDKHTQTQIEEVRK